MQKEKKMSFISKNILSLIFRVYQVLPVFRRCCKYFLLHFKIGLIIRLIFFQGPPGPGGLPGTPGSVGFPGREVRIMICVIHSNT